MAKMEIEISDKLSAAFQKAVAAYNAKQKDQLPNTPKQVVRRLIRTFTKDTLHAARIETANKAFKEELKDL